MVFSHQIRMIGYLSTELSNRNNMCPSGVTQNFKVKENRKM